MRVRVKMEPAGRWLFLLLAWAERVSPLGAQDKVGLVEAIQASLEPSRLKSTPRRAFSLLEMPLLEDSATLVPRSTG